MAEVQTDIDSEKHVEELCQPCSRKKVHQNAEIFCSTCKEFQCKECSNVHAIYAFMSSHKLVSVIEGKTHVSSTVCDDITISYKCTKHNKEFEFYYEQDDKFLCSKCLFVSNTNCGNDVDIDDMDGCGGCYKLKNELVAAIDLTEQDKELLDEADKNLSDDTDALLDKLKNVKTQFIQRIDDITDKFQTDVSEYRESSKGDLAKKKDKCLAKIKYMKKALAMINSMINIGTPTEQVITERRMQKAVFNAVKDANSLHEDNQIDYSTFVEHIEDLISGLQAELESEISCITLSLHKPSEIE